MRSSVAAVVAGFGEFPGVAFFPVPPPRLGGGTDGKIQNSGGLT